MMAIRFHFQILSTPLLTAFVFHLPTFRFLSQTPFFAIIFFRLSFVFTFAAARSVSADSAVRQSFPPVRHFRLH